MKLARADEHADELESHIAPVVESATDSIICHDGEDPSELIFKVTDTPRLDPQWSVIFGEGIFCIRSALDHLAWQLVNLDGGKPSHRTQFPVINGKRRLAQIDPGIQRQDILDGLEAVQPHNRGGPWVSQLWMVNELNRIDKHRLLLAVATVLNADTLAWGLDGGVPSPTYWFPVGLPLEDGDVVARFRFRGSIAPRDFEPSLRLQIGLSEGPEGNQYRNQSLPSLLTGLAISISSSIDLHFTHLFADEPPIWMLPP